MTVLVTGAAGFIGMHLCRRLLARGERVIGIDNLNDYYSVQLKEDRLATLDSPEFAFEKVDFADHAALEKALSDKEFDRIVHLGAQAGVRYSLTHPRAYIEANIMGHLNLMEIARDRQTAHMVYASSSSVYGGNESFPFRVEDRVDQPVSLYAATKKSDELMSETYAHLYRLPMTGLRFFTVYGPWGRPDMAMWIFTKKILAGEPIPVFNYGKMRRDFTYIEDIVTGVIAALDNPPADDGEEKAGGSTKPHALYNIGNNKSEELSHMIDVLEDALGKKAERDLQPIQPGDVPATAADISAIQRDLGFEPSTPIDVGIPKFVDWYRTYHGNRSG
ncbi:SDR family NAD(P)-dependent oxidoreductase [Parasphingopyxis algicola]|uniref:SDR family NAD(P)-dependent oxidoreductase n=1 Tax=Parasphingopyxis algicola TaxID=2026624 RepID=UPI0015A284DF|nr:SDR family NAD(P)-dependent oxidoreductase [Parasphingopyxis algicola]QLC23591.1 SDR family NAD(P)-dependent oxidoreductase [Parasphingopyxis algicola]